jgi:CheY-like chemotaxis protein
MAGDRPLVLIVDDETHILYVLELKLRNAGFDVATAEDGEEALEAARSELPDVIVSDYQMPLMDGLELCRALQEQPATAEIPVLILTAQGSRLDEADLDRTNIADVISKPFGPRDVLERIRELIPPRIGGERKAS